MNASLFAPRSRWLLALGLSGALAGCSSLESMMPSSLGGKTEVTQAGETPDSEKIKVLPLNAEDLDCPEVEIEDGGATARVGGPDNRAVRYQFDIKKIARECQPQGSQFSLKVGVDGLLLIGPAGSSGTYSTPLRVVVKREADQKNVFTKSYRIEASTEGGLQGGFQLVTEPILLPLERTNLNDQYSIFVGFDGGRPDQPIRKKPHKHRAAPTPAAPASSD